jgi:hypothetical protein
MSMATFASRFREQARRETRSIATRGQPGLPDDEYAFCEFYCTDRHCDCRRVLLWVMRLSTGEPVAVISHAFEPPRPGAYVQNQTFLDPLHPQASFAPRLLQLFKTTVLTPDYAQRLERHYAMMKGAEPPESPRGLVPPLRRSRLG